MKFNFTIFFLLISILVFSQNEDIQENIRINEKLKNYVEENNRINEMVKTQNENNRTERGYYSSSQNDNFNTKETPVKPELPPIPEDLSLENNHSINNSSQESSKPSFENKEYNVEKYYEKNNDGSYSLKDDYKKSKFEWTKNMFNKSNNSTPKQKVFQVIIIVFGWFVFGFILNFIFYSNTPEHLVGKSETARYFHIIINIIAAFLIFKTIL
jgi:ABC-type multidrug transport system fused ATPase/permease subunit